MKWIRTRLWKWADIALIKWSAALFGMIAGGYLSDFVKQYVFAILLVACLLAIKPLIYFYKDSSGLS